MSHGSEPSINELEQAGSRAAAQPVPAAPALGDVRRRAGRMALVRRTLAGGAAAVIAVGAGVGLAFATADRPTTEIAVAAAPQQAEDSQPADESPEQDEADESVPPVVTPSVTDEVAPAPTDEDEHHEDSLRFEFGPGVFDMGIRVLGGSAAVDAANIAADQAGEVREFEGETIWIDHRDGNTSAASALIDGDKFVEVTGPTDRIDDYLSLLDGDKLPLKSPFDKWFDESDRLKLDELPEGLVPGTEGFEEWLEELTEKRAELFESERGAHPFLFDDWDFGDESYFEGKGPLEFFFGFDGELDDFDFEWYHDEAGDKGFDAEHLKKFEAFLDGELPEDSAFEWFFGDKGLRFVHPDGSFGANKECVFLEGTKGSFLLEIPDDCGREGASKELPGD